MLHHVAIVYGEGISFWYVDPPKGRIFRRIYTGIVRIINQAWFMGALFLLAGYFTPGSFDRKGSGSFLKARLIRLGIPLIIWIFLFNPISNIGLYLEPVTWITEPLTWQNYWQMYPEFIGLGVAWFLALLLIFNFGYAAWRWLTRNRPSSSGREYSPPSYLGIGIFILGLALVTYLVRIVVPIGKTVLDFPTHCLPAAVSQLLYRRQPRLPPRLVPHCDRSHGQSRLCDRVGGDTLIIPDSNNGHVGWHNGISG